MKIYSFAFLGKQILITQTGKAQVATTASGLHFYLQGVILANSSLDIVALTTNFRGLLQSSSISTLLL